MMSNKKAKKPKIEVCDDCRAVFIDGQRITKENEPLLWSAIVEHKSNCDMSYKAKKGD